ncbi:hypothetical protein PLESTB_000445200 [Pleodorina starrii]|uniref:Plastid lipid-associated protein/fibrillin conserved domain-containing protein n=1 Tax=Pleodorina starrii TaxID=330485 RepID=A0A9W6BFP9_9CHLO|nr:hypothetical protein PLESTM_000675600 [Pleodorina starrii]GLC50905.1 hypothetical protein PLESTB_000445200 [Pleodorina starrii]GLC73902.1 hypothetical protein PLESTF_001435500 [Pleodorina starrii]
MALACPHTRISIKRPRVAPPRAGLFSFLTAPISNKAETRNALKEQLLERLEGLNRGASATVDDKAEVERLASSLEKLNPTSQPLRAPQLLSGKWRLLYTTSAAILATNRPPPLRPQGPIFQTIDVEKLKARNNETWPFFNQVSADLSPLSTNKVAVQFRTFKLLGFISITAPPSARGELSVTYLDDTLRISRGDKGNLFVLDMADRSVRLE